MNRSAAPAACRKARNKTRNPFAISINEDVPASNPADRKGAGDRQYDHGMLAEIRHGLATLQPSPATRRGASPPISLSCRSC